MVDEWKKNEAITLTQVSREYRAIANELSQVRDQLNRFNSTLLGSQVSGPPADYLAGQANNWQRPLQMAIDKLNQSAGDMYNTSTKWQKAYDEQKRQEKEDNERKAREKNSSPLTGGGGSW
jgi:septation ring formation regulator EzrA